MCFKSVEFNVEATKMSAEIQLTHQLLHESVNKVTAGVAVMKSNAGKMKLVKNEDFQVLRFGSSDEPQLENVQVWLCNHLPLKFIPPSRFQVNHHTAKLNAKDSINSLLDKHIIRVHERPFLCSPFSVVTNVAGELCLVCM